MDLSSSQPDLRNDVGVLHRREIEARMVAPLLERLGEEFGHRHVSEIAREVVVDISTSLGAALAELGGSNDLHAFFGGLENWTREGALEIDVLEQTNERLSFNVTRCRYAEMYQALGVPELGALLSCDRDATLVQGFNPEIDFERTQTIMEGASHCDFRFSQTSSPVEIMPRS